jgi:hypothetical protein
MLQELPSDWWKVTSKSENSYLVASMNFTYFWTPGTSVSQFPPIIEEYYRELMGCSERTGNGNYKINVNKKPKDVLVEFIGGNWYFWKELPSDLCWVFSFDESHIWQIPPFIGLFLTAQDLSAYGLLQQQLLSIPLYGLLTAQIPFHDGSNKTGTYTNDLRLSNEMVTGFTQLFANIAPPGVSIFANPFDDIKYHKFESVPNANAITMEALNQFSGTAGTSGLVSTSPKPSIATVKNSQLVESRFADVVYISLKYICNGSSDFSPILNATVGVVGVINKSTCLKALSKSSFINLLTFCALR